MHSIHGENVLITIITVRRDGCSQNYRTHRLYSPDGFGGRIHLDVFIDVKAKMVKVHPNDRIGYRILKKKTRKHAIVYIAADKSGLPQVHTISVIRSTDPGVRVGKDGSITFPWPV